MTDNEIVRCLEKWLKEMHLAYQTYLEYGGKQDARNEEHIDLIGSAIDLIEQQQEMIEALIAGQETLQKHFVDKMDKIVELLKMCAVDEPLTENGVTVGTVKVMPLPIALEIVKGVQNE